MIIISKKKLSEMNNNSTEKNIIQEAEGDKTFEVEYTVTYKKNMKGTSVGDVQSKIKNDNMGNQVSIRYTKEVAPIEEKVSESAGENNVFSIKYEYGTEPYDIVVAVNSIGSIVKDYNKKYWKVIKDALAKYIQQNYKESEEGEKKITEGFGDEYKDQSVMITSTKEVEGGSDDLTEGAYDSSFSDLKKALKRFDENGKIAKQGDWKIAKGGYDKNFEIYYKEDPIVGGFVGDSGTEVRVYDRENDLANKASEIVCSVYKDCYKSINEDLEKDVTMDNEISAELSDNRRAFFSLINDLIIGELDTINAYNGAIVTAKDLGLESASKLIQDISDEETRHIGELQHLMKTITPQAQEIPNGENEATEKMQDFEDGIDDNVDGAIGANSPLWKQTNAIVLDNVDDDIMGIESYL